MQKPVILLILDGWGIAPPGPGNALSLATLKHVPRYFVSYPHAGIVASGPAVGLPDGEDGNTETGHLNIGAGRIVYQDLPRINMSIADGSFFRNEAFLTAVKYAQGHGTNIHIMGLISDGGVHSSKDHLYALLELMKRENVPKVFLHLFTDGRDSPPQSSIRFITEVEERCKTLGVGKIATIMGRYYAMDRDRRWERTEEAYKALTEVIERTANSAQSAIEASYAKGKTDEFVDPTVILDLDNTPYPRVSEHDAVIFYNFRIDRPRELTRAFVLSDFETRPYGASFDPYAVKYFHKHVEAVDDDRNTPFTRAVVLPNILFVTMTEYERGLPCTVAFPPSQVKVPMGRVFAEQGLRQLRLSETEKERFVTYYFNGMREDPFAGEDHLIVPSPKVPTYDLKPEMSAYELTTKLIDRLAIGVYSLFVLNFANADMVAHTGNIQAAIRAVEVVDECVGKIVQHVLAIGGTCIITADHGNVEEMLGPNGEMDTEHSTFPVPLIIIDHMFDTMPSVLPNGKLGDIAPTILALRGMPIPGEMVGKNLVADLLMQRRFV